MWTAEYQRDKGRAGENGARQQMREVGFLASTVGAICGIGGGILDRDCNKHLGNRAVEKLFLGRMCGIVTICVCSNRKPLGDRSAALRNNTAADMHFARMGEGPLGRRGNSSAQGGAAYQPAPPICFRSKSPGFGQAAPPGK